MTWVLASLFLLPACAPEEDATTRRSRPARDHTGDTDSADADTDTDADADADADADTDGDGDADADTDADGDPGPLTGIDVSHWQGDIDWHRVAADGVTFAVMKATEGTDYVDDQFSTNYADSYAVGLVRGAYHFANPDESDGGEQADFFVDHGGDWAADDQTLPGVLDIEWSSTDACWGLSKGEMIDWITEFNDAYERRTGRFPMIYTAASWWSECVNSAEFAGTNPLWVAHYTTGTPNLPTGWTDYTFWQYTSEGAVAGVDGDCDTNVFQDGTRELRDFANGT